jgi:hypothetical protein
MSLGTYFPFLLRKKRRKKKLTSSRLVNRFRVTGSVQDRNQNSSLGCIKREVKSESKHR